MVKKIKDKRPKTNTGKKLVKSNSLKNKKIKKSKVKKSSKRKYNKLTRNISKKKNKLKSQKPAQAFKINNKKLIELAEIDDIEDIYYLIHLLNEEQLKKVISYFVKNNKKQNKIAQIIKEEKSKEEILNDIKKEIISKLKDDTEKLKQEISNLRKKGNEMSLESIKSLYLPLKIKLYEATFNKKDYLAIKKILHDLSLSVEDEKRKLELNHQ